MNSANLAHAVRAGETKLTLSSVNGLAPNAAINIEPGTSAWETAHAAKTFARSGSDKEVDLLNPLTRNHRAGAPVNF